MARFAQNSTIRSAFSYSEMSDGVSSVAMPVAFPFALNATFERSAAAFDNPDYVDVVIHSYRHRYGLADSDPRYADVQRRLAAHAGQALGVGSAG